LESPRFFCEAGHRFEHFDQFAVGVEGEETGSEKIEGLVVRG